MFQNELFYNALCKYVSKWCKGFEPLLEVIGEFEGTLEEFWLFFIDWVGMVYNLFQYLLLLADLLLSLQLSEEKQRLISSEEWHHSQLELPEDNHTDAGKHIKAILNIIMYCRCCLPDVSVMAIQYKMLMMAN